MGCAMRFIREIPANGLTDGLIKELEQFGYTLVYKEDSLEVWADMLGTGAL